MTNYLKIKETVEKNSVLELSSSFTKAGSIFTFVLALVFFLIVITSITTHPGAIKGNMMLTLALITLIFGLSTYQLLHAADAKLKGKQLILKTVLGKEYQIHVNQIQNVSGFALKSTKYTIIKFADIDNTLRTILILNSNSIIFGRETSAKDIIQIAQQL